jgi:hypothetical protein
MKNAYKILVGNPEGKGSLERSRRRLDEKLIVRTCGLNSSGSVGDLHEHGNEPSVSMNGW